MICGYPVKCVLVSKNTSADIITLWFHDSSD